MGTLNWRSQETQTPIAGIVPSHLTTRRLRFGTAGLSDDNLMERFLFGGSGGSGLRGGSLSAGDCSFGELQLRHVP
jgi:hypothetical protein